MSAVHLPGRLRPGPTLTVVALSALALLVGVLALPGTPVQPLPDLFGTGELIAWCAIGLATGGVVFGRRERRSPVLASGLVGSAALLGAGPGACAVVAVAGAVGGFRHLGGLRLLRAGVAALWGWALPGALALAAGAGGPVLGRGLPIQLAEVVALWGVLALAVPVLEGLGARLVLPSPAVLDVDHVVRRRLEPQTVLSALAVVGALSYAAIGPAAGLVVLLPAAAARIGFARHAEGRRAVSQTLAAMTVLPEWAGMVDVGHTARVREAVEAVALHQRLPSMLRRDIVRAAELHELGHLDGGVAPGDRGRVVRSGAAVLEQAGARDRVVAILEACDPDRAVPAADPDVAAAGALLTAACELDRTSPIDDPTARAEQVERRAADRAAAHRPWRTADPSPAST